MSRIGSLNPCLPSNGGGWLGSEGGLIQGGVWRRIKLPTTVHRRKTQHVYRYQATGYWVNCQEGVFQGDHPQQAGFARFREYHRRREFPAFQPYGGPTHVHGRYAAVGQFGLGRTLDRYAQPVQ